MNLFQALPLALVLVLATGCKKTEDPAPPATPTTGAAAIAVGSAVNSGAAAPTTPTTPTAPTADRLVLRPAPPKVGDKATKTHDSSMVMTFSDGREMTRTKHTEDTREILEVDGDVITRAKLTYVAHTQSHAMAGKTRDQPSLLTGKAYVVWRKAGTLDATRADGSTVPADEREELFDDNKRLGRPDIMDRIVASKAWKVGEKVVFTPAELAEINQREPGGEAIVGVTLTLIGVESGVARMAMTMAMATKGPQDSIDMAITGTTRVDVASGRLLEAGGTGPLKGTMGLPVYGTVMLKTGYTY